MSNDDPRSDEQAALDAICAVVEVAEFEWIPEENRRTPDLRLQLADGRVIHTEVTLSADEAAKKLVGSVGSEKPFPFKKLDWDWTVWTRENHAQERDELGRSPKKFVKSMVPVMATIEAQGIPPNAMRDCANAAFDDHPYDIVRSFAGGPRQQWLNDSPTEMEFEEWALQAWLPHCDYWYVPDLTDAVVHDLSPRRVSVVREPTPATGSMGSIEVHTSALEPGLAFGAADHLLPAIERAVGKKQDRNQMAGYDGEHWLAVAVEGNAAAQLEEACAPDEPGTPADLSSVQFDGFDELWVFGCTFHGWRYSVARFREAGSHPTLCTVPRPPKTDTEA